MTEEVVSSPVSLIDTDTATSPAPGAEEQKPNAAPETPASGADDQNTEAATPETPEQEQARRESRRARQNARRAAELAEARTEARMLRERLTQIEQRGAPQQPAEPKREDFQDYESYLRAVTRYDAKQEAAAVARAEREANRGQQQQGRAEAAQREIEQDWTKRETAFKASTPDYEEAITDYVETALGQLSNEARRAIVDLGPQLLHHLATKPEEHERISGLSPMRQVAELGKIEATLTAPKPRKVSEAPAPIKPVGQGRSTSAGYSENMSSAEFKEWAKANGARWAR